MNAYRAADAHTARVETGTRAASANYPLGCGYDEGITLQIEGAMVMKTCDINAACTLWADQVP